MGQLGAKGKKSILRTGHSVLEEVGGLAGVGSRRRGRCRRRGCRLNVGRGGRGPGSRRGDVGRSGRLVSRGRGVSRSRGRDVSGRGGNVCGSWRRKSVTLGKEINEARFEINVLVVSVDEDSPTEVLEAVETETADDEALRAAMASAV